MQLSNPFFNRNSIVHPRYFYNRSEMVSKVLDLLYKGVCVMVTGPRRIGRSSFLRYLSESSLHSNFGIRSAIHPIFVYVDCTSCQLQPPHVFYITVLTRLRSAMVRAGLDVSTLEAIPPIIDGDTFGNVISHVTDKYHHVILLLDEFDYVYRNPHVDEAFFAMLRSLNTQQLVTICMASLNPGTDQDGIERYASTAAFNSIFIRFPLTLFSRDEARLLIEHQLSDEKPLFRAETVDYLIDVLAGPHPYLLQVAAYEAFEMAVISEGFLTVKRMDELDQRFTEQAKHYWLTQFSQLSLAEQRALALINMGIQPTPEVGARLYYAGLVVHDGSQWWYLSQAFQNFIRSQYIEGLVQHFLHLAGSHGSSTHLLIDQLERKIYLNGVQLNLTSLPMQLLTCLAERPNQIVSIQEIEMRLWPGDKYYDGSEERIKPHIRVLREILGNPAYIQNRRGIGYMLTTK